MGFKLRISTRIMMAALCAFEGLVTTERQKPTTKKDFEVVESNETELKHTVAQMIPEESLLQRQGI
jgi:hypothetical protein